MRIITGPEAGYFKDTPEDTPEPQPAGTQAQEEVPDKPSWWEYVLPACERGLPCDDCGMCH